MDNPRAEKVAVATEVRERLKNADAAILTEYRGLKVKNLAALRRSLAPVGGEYKVYKNTLARFAVREAGVDELEPMLVGPTAITFVKGDAAAVAKVLRDFSATNPLLVIKGGVLGDKVISAAETTALALLPSRDVLLGRLAGGLAAPLTQMASLLQALPRGLAYGLQALIASRGGEAPTAEAEPAEAEPAEAEAPTAEAPTAEAPTAEAPTAEAPTAEAPTAEAATAEADSAEADSAEADSAEAESAEPAVAPTDAPELADAEPAVAPTAEAEPAQVAPTAEAEPAQAATDTPTPDAGSEPADATE